MSDIWFCRVMTVFWCGVAIYRGREHPDYAIACMATIASIYTAMILSAIRRP